MKGYYISVKNDLLDPKHRQKIGSAIWEFMWLIDKTTSISEEGIGTVLGGKSINLAEISQELGSAHSTISENLTKLEKEGYINIRTVSYGLIITVNKSSKFFGKTNTYEVSENTKPAFGKPNEVSENTKRTIYNTKTIQSKTPFSIKKEEPIDHEKTKELLKKYKPEFLNK